MSIPNLLGNLKELTLMVKHDCETLKTWIQDVVLKYHMFTHTKFSYMGVYKKKMILTLCIMLYIVIFNNLKFC